MNSKDKLQSGGRVGFGLSLLAAASASLLLAGCVQDDAYLPRNSRHYVPIPDKTIALMSEKSMTKNAPILIRAYKQESELEIWKKDQSGKYALLKTFPMCRWSGQLGPKTREGDRQVPEGFYTITPSQLNPNSNYYVSFNVGYPNALDRAYGRTGGQIMVHGACSSAGCLSMTDEEIAEIYAITREAFTGGQKAVQMQTYPFHMTPKNLAKFRADPNIAFWRNLKEGSDHFEVTKEEPKVAMCGKKYVFDASGRNGASMEASSPCPALDVNQSVAEAVAEKRQHDDTQVAELVAQGEKAVRRVYVDGDQHPSFRNTVYGDNSQIRTLSGRFVDVSRADAVAVGVSETPVEDGKPAPAVLKLAKMQATAKAQESKTLESKGLDSKSLDSKSQAQERPAAANASETTATVASAVQAPAPASSSGFLGGLSFGAKSVPSPVADPAAGNPPQAPFYKRLLGFGGGDQPDTTAAAAAADEPTNAQPALVPLPPMAPTRPTAAKPASTKQKQASLPSTMLPNRASMEPTGLVSVNQ